MPAWMAINTENKVAYNNQLKQAVPGMKFGVNDEVNTSSKKLGVSHMEGGPPKMNRPTNQPSNTAPDVPAQPDKSGPVQGRKVRAQPDKSASAQPTAHETNKSGS